MTLSMNHKDLKTLRDSRKKKVNSSRKRRSSLLSGKTMKKVLKKFDEDHENVAVQGEDITIDEHVKLNDSYMRTGWYVPKKK